MGDVFDKKILIVEDELDLCELYEYFLEGLDLFCVSTTCPTQGIKLLCKYRFDLIITDYKMKPMTGVEFARVVRDIDSYNPAILLVTGEIELAKEDLKYVDDVLYKPFSDEDLVAKVKQFVG